VPKFIGGSSLVGSTESAATIGEIGSNSSLLGGEVRGGEAIPCSRRRFCMALCCGTCTGYGVSSGMLSLS